MSKEYTQKQRNAPATPPPISATVEGINTASGPASGNFPERHIIPNAHALRPDHTAHAPPLRSACLPGPPARIPPGLRSGAARQRRNFLIAPTPPKAPPRLLSGRRSPSPGEAPRGDYTQRGPIGVPPRVPKKTKTLLPKIPENKKSRKIYQKTS